MSDLRSFEREVAENFAAFEERLPSLLRENPGQFVLMRHGDMVEFFDSAGDARKYGNVVYQDGLFSIQEIKSKPLDLGHFSHGGTVADL